MGFLLLELRVVLADGAILFLDDLNSDELIGVGRVWHALVVLGLLKGELLHVINLVLLLQLRHNLPSIEVGRCELELRIGEHFSVVGEMAAWLHLNIFFHFSFILFMHAFLDSLTAFFHLLLDSGLGALLLEHLVEFSHRFI